MESIAQQVASIPAEVGEGLDRLCQGLREALGDQLVSVILYGGLAKGEYAQPNSNVNVMIVVKEASVEVMDRALPPVQAGMRDLRLAVMFLSEGDLRRSADVFPTKYLDMQRFHRVLWGRDVLANLPIATDHLRLRCAQEIKNLLLRLRQFYLQRAQYPELIEGTLTRAISSFLHSLSVLLTLKGVQVPAGKAAIAEAAARELGLDGGALRDLLALKAGEIKPDGAAVKRLYNAFMVTVQRAADIVDGLRG